MDLFFNFSKGYSIISFCDVFPSSVDICTKYIPELKLPIKILPPLKFSLINRVSPLISKILNSEIKFLVFTHIISFAGFGTIVIFF